MPGAQKLRTTINHAGPAALCRCSSVLEGVLFNVMLPILARTLAVIENFTELCSFFTRGGEELATGCPESTEKETCGVCKLWIAFLVWCEGTDHGIPVQLRAMKTLVPGDFVVSFVRVGKTLWGSQ
jgi:hypothetical protein